MTEIERVRAAYAQYKDMDIQKILLEYRDFALKGGIPNVQSPHYALAGMFEWAVAALSAQASRVAELEAEVARLREASQELNQWASAYPVSVFKEPDLDEVKAILAEAGELAQMDRMHASWARDILSRVRKITDEALGRDGEG